MLVVKILPVIGITEIVSLIQSVRSGITFRELFLYSSPIFYGSYPTGIRPHMRGAEYKNKGPDPYFYPPPSFEVESLWDMSHRRGGG